MRFQHKEKKQPRHGDTRIIKKFSLLPKRLEDTTSWLQFDYIFCVYIVTHEYLPEYPVGLKLGWNEIYFVRKIYSNLFKKI